MDMAISTYVPKDGAKLSYTLYLDQGMYYMRINNNIKLVNLIILQTHPICRFTIYQSIIKDTQYWCNWVHYTRSVGAEKHCLAIANICLNPLLIWASLHLNLDIIYQYSFWSYFTHSPSLWLHRWQLLLHLANGGQCQGMICPLEAIEIRFRGTRSL